MMAVMTAMTKAVVTVALTMMASIALKLSHVQAMVLFALVISVAFGFLGRRRSMDRVKYILWTLFLFLLIGVGIGWAMYPFSH